MPKVDKYLAGFNIKEGMTLNGYTLQSVSSDHVTVKRYQQYSYPTRMSWTKIDPQADQSAFLSSLYSHVSGDRTIYTRYGNPYSCNFGSLSTEATQSGLNITANGTCNRVHN